MKIFVGKLSENYQCILDILQENSELNQVTLGRKSIDQNLCKIFSKNVLVYPADLGIKYSLFQIIN